jgi:cytoskeletal protein RodZ
MVRNKFTTKSVRTVTLGEKLKEIRNEKRMSLAEVSKGTKIQVKYLEKLEEGKYQELPADVYVKGFLKSYAAFLGVGEMALIKSYEREREIQKNIQKKDFKENLNKPIDISNFTITPKHIIFGLIFIFIALGFFYIYREANLFISTPRLTVTAPVDGTTTSERVIQVSGIAERDADVSINNQKVVVNDDGKFSEEVGLQSGVNAITIRAKNRFDKEAMKTIQVKGEFQSEVEVAGAEEGLSSEAEKKIENFKVEIFVDPDPTWLSVEADGNLLFSGIQAPGKNLEFDVKTKISISSAKGNNTYLKINGKEKQLLSTDPGMVKNIEFSGE